MPKLTDHPMEQQRDLSSVGQTTQLLSPKAVLLPQNKAARQRFLTGLFCICIGVVLLLRGSLVAQPNWLGAAMLLIIACGLFIWGRQPYLRGLHLAGMILCGLSVSLIITPFVGGIALLGGLGLGVILGLILVSRA